MMPSRAMACSRRGAPVRLWSPAPQQEKKEPITMTQGEGQARTPMTGLRFTDKPNLEGSRTRTRAHTHAHTRVSSTSQLQSRRMSYGLTCPSGPLPRCRRQRKPHWRRLSPKSRSNEHTSVPQCPTSVPQRPTSRIQMKEVVRTAMMVPMGMDLWASRRSPDRLEPAMIPKDGGRAEALP